MLPNLILNKYDKIVSMYHSYTSQYYNAQVALGHNHGDNIVLEADLIFHK